MSGRVGFHPRESWLQRLLTLEGEVILQTHGRPYSRRGCLQEGKRRQSAEGLPSQEGLGVGEKVAEVVMTVLAVIVPVFFRT